MDDAVGVDRAQPVEDLNRDSNGLVDGQRCPLTDNRCQRLAVDELHDEEQLAGILAGVVHGDKMRMLQASRRAALRGGSDRDPDGSAERAC